MGQKYKSPRRAQKEPVPCDGEAASEEGRQEKRWKLLRQMERIERLEDAFMVGITLG
jgi:hypothetical protein